LWLLANEKGKKNSALCSADGTSSVFNGDDSLSFEFGDETDLTGMAWLFSSVGSSLYNVMIFFLKQSK
jgi:hypothetical protein